MKRIFLFLVLSPLLISLCQAQQYGKMKITLADGPTIDCKKGTITDQSVSCMVDGQLQTYSLTDVSLVSAKKGNAVMWAVGSGGCCAVVAIASYFAVDTDELDVTFGQYLVGTAIWTGLFAGAGYLVGSLLDPWKNVYVRNIPSVFNRLNLNFDLDRQGRPLFGVSYRF